MKANVEAGDTLRERAEARIRRLRTLAGDPYATGAEATDAGLLTDLLARVQALGAQLAEVSGSCCCWKHARGRCLQCPQHGVAPPKGRKS